MHQRFVGASSCEQCRRKPTVKFPIVAVVIRQKPLQSHNEGIWILGLLSRIQQTGTGFPTIEIKSGGHDQIEHPFLNSGRFQQALMVAPVLNGDAGRPAFLSQRPDQSDRNQQGQHTNSQQQAQRKQALGVSKRTGGFSNRSASC